MSPCAISSPNDAAGVCGRAGAENIRRSTHAPIDRRTVMTSSVRGLLRKVRSGHRPAHVGVLNRAVLSEHREQTHRKRLTVKRGGATRSTLTHMKCFLL